ncbi:MAG TPA: proline--tRNA ligase [Acidobacteriota bacterium]|nr:proline--tRNA ligase [Acidobacteriota bacterium]
MRWSNLFAPTLREAPADAEVASHRLLVRAGYIRQLGAGLYSYLPMARRSLLKIEQIIREEMNRIGGQEFYLPALNPDDIWRESGRWETMGDNMFRLKDRFGRDLCLGMTHEEVFTAIARNELRSYRDLPQIWYQIQVKFRDEPRPKSGLLRVRQFLMKDSYSFDVDDVGLDRSYRLHAEAYRRIFTRCGLRFLAVEASSGAMGGSRSEEFVVFSDAGEDWIVHCECGYAANRERAVSALPPAEDPPGDEEPRPVHTPGKKTIDEVSSFLELPQWRHIKSLVYIVESQPCMLLLRGDHQLSEAKLGAVLGTEQFRPATAEEIREAFGADPGSLGPVGVTSLRILADEALRGRRDMVCGANRDDYHLVHVTPGSDFIAEFADLREVQAGDPCLRCGKPLRLDKAVEVGHIFKLGVRYSSSMGATVLNREGREVPIVMGSYGIGLERILASAVELYHDDKGIVLPRSIAPFEVVITLVRPDDADQQSVAEQLYGELLRNGVDCLVDDRNERPGVKFNDAELVGIPLRITVGKKLADRRVEIFHRRLRHSREVPVAEAVPSVISMLEGYDQLAVDGERSGGDR